MNSIRIVYGRTKVDDRKLNISSRPVWLTLHFFLSRPYTLVGHFFNRSVSVASTVLLDSILAFDKFSQYRYKIIISNISKVWYDINPGHKGSTHHSPSIIRTGDCTRTNENKKRIEYSKRCVDLCMWEAVFTDTPLFENWLFTLNIGYPST